jgi:hypothetical protein
MERQFWAVQYKKLLTAYNKTMNAEQLAVFYDGLESLPGPIVAEAVDALIRERSQWPRVSDIRDKVTSLVAGRTYAPSKCDVCHGDGWITAPSQYHFDQPVAYQYVRRCPQCYPSASAAERPVSSPEPVADEPLSAEQQAEFLDMLRATKEKLFGKTG